MLRGTFTDVRFALRYNVTRSGAVFTPYIGSVVPSHDYAYYGHAAAGERLKELQVGAYAAKLFTAGLPGVFVSGRLGYGFVEKVQDISHNRSLADLEVGYFLTPSFRAFAMTSGQYTHGGIDFPINGLPAVPLSTRRRTTSSSRSTTSMPEAASPIRSRMAWTCSGRSRGSSRGETGTP